MQPIKILGEKLICPVCKREFVATKNTYCIIYGGYPCSTRCFLNEVKCREKEGVSTKKPRKEQMLTNCK